MKDKADREEREAEARKLIHDSYRSKCIEHKVIKDKATKSKFMQAYRTKNMQKARQEVAHHTAEVIQEQLNHEIDERKHEDYEHHKAAL